MDHVSTALIIIIMLTTQCIQVIKYKCILEFCYHQNFIKWFDPLKGLLTV